MAQARQGGTGRGTAGRGRQDGLWRNEAWQGTWGEWVGAVRGVKSGVPVGICKQQAGRGEVIGAGRAVGQRRSTEAAASANRLGVAAANVLADNSNSDHLCARVLSGTASSRQTAQPSLLMSPLLPRACRRCRATTLTCAAMSYDTPSGHVQPSKNNVPPGHDVPPGSW